MLFSVTYETITPESAEHGDTETDGFVCQDVSFRDALDAFGYAGEVCEANCCPVSLDIVPRWFTNYRTGENYATGETENRSLHLPGNITPSSALRIARLVGCYGISAS